MHIGYRNIGTARTVGIFLFVLVLIFGIFCTYVYTTGALGTYTVSFVNYDMSELEADDSTTYRYESVPNGTMLYHKNNIPESYVREGCSWYLYRPADGNQSAYGPVAIPDPPQRIGYEFYDWASQQGDSTQLHTVNSDTVFMARYARSGQYLVNLYYQYNDETRSIAAPTTSFACGLGDTIEISLPNLSSLTGLTPEIQCLFKDTAAAGVVEAQNAAATLNNNHLKNGKFTATLNEDFLKLCRTAWFVEWDTGTSNYKTDEYGVVQINIPVIYAFNGTAQYRVHYYQQSENNPTDYEAVESDFVTQSVTGTTHISLEELGLVKDYEGFTLNPISRQYANSYTVNPDGSTVIDLHYDRDRYYVTYVLHGGTLIEPEPFRYGQTLPIDENGKSPLLATPVRSGYTFAGWTLKDSHGNILSSPASLPSTMPAYDLILEANWTTDEADVTITYWLENANDEDYTPVGSRTITAPTESTLAYSDIAVYLEPDSEGMEAAGIDDGEYFSLVTSGDKAIQPASVTGDGSTTINAYYDRKQYTLVFHIGWISDGQNGTPQNGYYCISTGGNSNAENDSEDWVSGYKDWKAGARNVSLKMLDRSYSISNETEECYQITAKYGAFISELWPVASDTTAPTDVTAADGQTYQLFTWGTHAASPYFQNRVASGANKNIMGVYPSMSAELIIDPNDPSVVHHLTAYWAAPQQTTSTADVSSFKNHHYLFEAVPGAVDEDTTLVYGDAYGSDKIAANCPSTVDQIASIQFYEHQSLKVRTTHTSAGQNPPAFANLTFQYGCYKGADVYFFYTYNDYTITYDENNANLTTGASEGHNEIQFHSVGGKPIKDAMVVEPGFDYDYTPNPAYVCLYGNEHIFGGWYKDPDCTVPIDWSTAASDSSLTAYAKWNSPTFDLTLTVPGGYLSESILASIRSKGYSNITSDTDGLNIVYTIHDVVDGTPINEILIVGNDPTSNLNLPFKHWYEVDEDGTQIRFLFDDSQVMSSNRTLTAQWEQENTGVYVVQYLTTTDPGNHLEADDTGYYRLMDDKRIEDIALGSNVTLEPEVISGYLPTHGSLSQVITGTADSPTVFSFIYEPITNQSVKYTIHHVLDLGEDYGRIEAENMIALSDDVTITLTATAARTMQATNQITGSVQAMAPVIPGYSARDGYQTMALSSNNGENHMYFYYISNVDDSMNAGNSGIDCYVKYFEWDEGNSKYCLKQTDAIENIAIGTVLYAEHYANKYLAGSHSLTVDKTLTNLILNVSRDGDTLAIYLKPHTTGSDEDNPVENTWGNPPAGLLPPPDDDYVATNPPLPVPDQDIDQGEGEPNPDDGNTNPDGDDTDSDDGDSGSYPDSNIPVTIYYTLRYESSGGTVYGDERYPQNSIVELDKTPMREGYHFTGWYADAACTVPLTNVRMTRHMTVYAGWEKSAVPDMLNGSDHFAYVIGYPDGTVRPLAEITRAEVAAIFFRLLKPEIRDEFLTDTNPFEDVPADAWYNKAVSTLHALGIFHGKSETLFDGASPITRGEFAAVCARFDDSIVEAQYDFLDIEGHWAEESIQHAAALGWILGYQDKTFRPDQPITRAEVMVMVNRVLSRIPETADDLLPGMKVWADNLPTDWYYLPVQEATNSHTYIPKNELNETWTQLQEEYDWTQYQ